jgi:AcrR family transcriptional regulator
MADLRQLGRAVARPIARSSSRCAVGVGLEGPSYRARGEVKHATYALFLRIYPSEGVVSMLVLARDVPLEKPSRDSAIRRAKQLFLRGERIDMQQMATELGIGRATLYRWVGDRDTLIADAIWSFAGPFLEGLASSTRQRRGRERLLHIINQMGTDLLSLDSFSTFLKREPAAALRILTTTTTHIQDSMIEFLSRILTEEIERGALELPPGVQADSVAYTILRIAESYFYADIIAGRPADVAQAVRMIDMLLGGNVPSLRFASTG